MKFFPIVGKIHLEELIALFGKDRFFLEKLGLDLNSIVLSDQTFDKLFSHPRRLWMLLGDSESPVLGVAVFSFQGVPHSFANLNVALSSSSANQFCFSIKKLAKFGFEEMALRSLQITLLEGEEVKIDPLLSLGWTLDATLCRERLRNGRWINEYRLGKTNISTF